MGNPESFRPRSNLVLAGAIFFVAGGLGLSAFPLGTTQGRIVAATWTALACYATYLCFVRPRLVLADEGATIINPLRDITVGWDAVQAIDAQYTMSLVVGGKRIYAWAAPAPGRYHARSVHPAEIRGLRVDATDVRVGESPRSDSGVATHLTRLRYDAFNARGTASGVETHVETKRAHAFALGGLALLSLIVTVVHF